MERPAELREPTSADPAHLKDIEFCNVRLWTIPSHSYLEGSSSASGVINQRTVAGGWVVGGL